MSAPEASQISEQMEPGGRGAVAGEAWPGYCGGSQPAMTRTNAVALLIAAAAGCYTPARILPVPAAVVNDACGGNGTAETCAQTAGCEWRAISADCPAGADCPQGICATPDACGALTARAACEADTRCAWSGQRPLAASIDLCPLGQSCATGGYCHTRDASGGGCTCVQPIACPAGADCPAVACDCSNPSPSGGAGGGTCTCACPACAPGETCPPCACTCAGGGACSGGGAAAGGTCACTCPACAPGAACPPCDCACGAGNVGIGGSSAAGTPTMTMRIGGGGPAGADLTDPCAAHGDAQSCGADSADACRWIELGIVCIAAPCPSGMCVGMTQTPPGDGGADAGAGAGGCGCACAACAAGQSCPPCTCSCCGPTTPPLPIPA